MSQKIHWLNAVSGSFTNPGDWSGGVVPGATDKAVIDAVGADPYTVTSAVDETVRTLQTGAEATLAVTGGTFTATDGTGSAKQGNAGVILIGAGATFAAGGTIANSGTIALDGPTGKTGRATLTLDTYTTLTGGGEISLGGGGGDVVVAGHRFAILYNTNNTIIGSGTIGDKHLLVINEQGGVINANGSTPMLLIGNVKNAGLMEATGSGGLVWVPGSGSGNFSTGVVLAGNGSTVRVGPANLAHGAICDLYGGTLESMGTGAIIGRYVRVGGGITNNAQLLLGLDCSFSGTVTNNGTISTSYGVNTNGGVTIEGGGELIVKDGVGVASGGTLTLAGGAITGSGVIGSYSGEGCTLNIGVGGIVDADDANGFRVNAVTLINAGTLESTGAGGEFFQGPIDNSGLVAASAGVLAVGTASAPESTVNTGTLSVSGTGTLIAYGAVTGNGVARIGGGTMDFASSFNEMVAFTGPGGVLELAQSQSYTKAISGFSASGQTSLDLGDIGFVGAGQATFSGTATSGVLTVTDGTHTAHITFKGDYRSTTFVAAADGHGGTDVTAQAAGAARPPHALIAAMATLGAAGGQGLGHSGAVVADRQALLFAPRPGMA
jgi:hypothetical protein